MYKLLPLVLLVGCWSYIDQPWPEDDPPATTVIYGRGNAIAPIGSYWQSAVAEWTLWFGWLAAPQANLFAYTPSSACTLDELAVDGSLPAFADLSPAPPLTLNTAADSLSPVWEQPSNAYVIAHNTTMYARGTAFSLALASINGTTQSVAPLFRMPPALDVLTPDMTGASPPIVPRADITFTWDVLAAKAAEIDHVQATMVLADGAGFPMGVIVCWGAYEAGTLTVTASQLANIGTANYATVLIGALTETATAVDGVDGASRVGMGNYIQGAVLF